MLITSPANPRVGMVRDLHAARGRKKSGLVLIEGLNVFEMLLDAGLTPREAYYHPESLQRTARGRTLLQRLLRLPQLTDAQRVEVNTRVIEAMSDVATSQGVVGVLPLDVFSPEVVRKRREQYVSRTSSPQRPVLLVLDAISDPGNMGTILRTALAADVDAVLLTPDCTDPYSPKVLRAATGTHFFLPIESDASWKTIEERVHTHNAPALPRVLLAEAASARMYYEEDLKSPFTLIIGNEAHGPSAEARALMTTSITIPLANNVESLNAAMAAGILLYDAVRQRSPQQHTRE